jgi:cation transport regulator ChaC
MNGHKLKCISIANIILIMWAPTAFTFDCHPKIRTQLPQYILGYGSLIDEQSKQKTNPTAEESFPVFIKGYQRHWGAHGNLPGLNATFLSIVENHAASFNGVIYKLSHPNTIEQYDKRERIYCRKQLDAAQLQTGLTKNPIM